jgi:hypothetical protein
MNTRTLLTALALIASATSIIATEPPPGAASSFSSCTGAKCPRRQAR